MKKLIHLLNDSKSPFPQDDHCTSICILYILSQNMKKYSRVRFDKINNLIVLGTMV